MKTKSTAVALLLVVVAGTLVAHDLFMKLDTYFLAPDSPVTVPIYNGTFMKSENSITADRVLDMSVFKHGKRIEHGTKAWLAGENNYTTYVTVQTGAPGTYVLGMSTRHRDLGMDAADFNGYLEHDGIPDVLEARRRDGELDRDVWERYGKHVKAVVQVGDTRTDDFSAQFGYPAEIVPMVNPYTLGIGDEIVVQCFVDGKPVANQLVIAGGHGDGGAIEERSRRADANGKVRFRIREAGRWYVKFIHMVKEESDPDIDYESKWATLTFEVRPPSDD